MSGRNGLLTFPTTTLAIRGQAILNDKLIVGPVVADEVPGNPRKPGGTQVLLRKDDGVFVVTEFTFYNLRERKKKDQRHITRNRPFHPVFQRGGCAAPMVYQGKYAIGLWGSTTNLNDLSKTNRSLEAP